MAFYVGSLEGADGSGDGNLLYALADKRCENYGTCDDDGMSAVNSNVMQLFDRGLEEVQSGGCADLVSTKNAIVKQMIVPMVQGTLRYAYKLAYLSGGHKELSEGDAFATAVVPFLYQCSDEDADLVRDNLNFEAVSGSALTDSVMADGFDAVKAAFEDNYGCLGITCADMGCLLDSSGECYDEFSICKDSSTASSSSDKEKMAQWAIALIVALCLFVCIMCAVAAYFKSRMDQSERNFLKLQDQYGQPSSTKGENV